MLSDLVLACVILKFTGLAVYILGFLSVLFFTLFGQIKFLFLMVHVSCAIFPSSLSR